MPRIAGLLVATLFLSSLAAQAQDESPPRFEFSSLQHEYVAERVAGDLSQPVAIEFLPDGKALVGQRNLGIVSVIDFSDGSRKDVTGLPKLAVYSDAGIHDLELHPDFADNGWVYVSYSVGEEIHSSVALDRFHLDGTRASDQQRLFTADAYTEEAYHQGGRIGFHEGHVYLSLGDRQHREMSQDNSNHAGTIVRLLADGKVPDDNPFVGVKAERGEDPRPEIWSSGHRNPQGLAFHPETGELWSHEHGPRGGDELNRVTRGGNYGWPTISFGLEYDGGPIGMGITRKEGMEQPAWVWVPSIAPSDLLIYTGDAFPGWKGSFFTGSLAKTHLNRLVLREGSVVAEERLANNVLGRIRSLAVDRRGLIYLGSDTGTIWRISPLP
jgi:glucose/arabinose dehydrogenase